MKTLERLDQPGPYSNITIIGTNRDTQIGLHVHVPKGQHIHIPLIHISNVFIPLIKTGYGLLTWDELVIRDFGGDGTNIRSNGNIKGNILEVVSHTPTRPYNLCKRLGNESVEQCLLRNHESVYDPSLLDFEWYRGEQVIMGYHVDAVMQTYATPEEGYPTYTDGSGIIHNIDIATIKANITGSKTQAIMGSERCRYENIKLGYKLMDIKMDGYPYHAVFNTLTFSILGANIGSNTTVKIKDVKGSGHPSGHNRLHTRAYKNQEKQDMRLSQAGMTALLHEEGLRQEKYRDSKGLWTIGVGHLLTPEELSRGYIRLHSGKNISIDSRWTKQEVSELLRDDLYRFRKAVNRLKDNINQGQFDALISFAFNIGVGGFLKSTAYRRVKANRHDEVPSAMMMWVKPPELYNRRHREATAYAKATNESSLSLGFKPSFTKSKLAGGELTQAELETAMEILG